jgi:hypothetical protein
VSVSGSKDTVKQRKRKRKLLLALHQYLESHRHAGFRGALGFLSILKGVLCDIGRDGIQPEIGGLNVFVECACSVMMLQIEVL